MGDGGSYCCFLFPMKIKLRYESVVVGYLSDFHSVSSVLYGPSGGGIRG